MYQGRRERCKPMSQPRSVGGKTLRSFSGTLQRRRQRVRRGIKDSIFACSGDVNLMRHLPCRVPWRKCLCRGRLEATVFRIRRRSRAVSLASDRWEAAMWTLAAYLTETPLHTTPAQASSRGAFYSSLEVFVAQALLAATGVI